MRNNLSRIFIPLFIYVLTIGCISNSHINKDYLLASTNTRLAKGVPFYPDGQNLCGPSSLASVLNYWGGNETVEGIKGEIYIERLRGTFNIDMENYARKKGFKTSSFAGKIEDIKREILLGRPLIAFINLGYKIFPWDHYLVIVGYNEEEGYIVTYSGKEKFRLFTFNNFMKAWEKTNYWTLLIRPK